MTGAAATRSLSILARGSRSRRVIGAARVLPFARVASARPSTSSGCLGFKDMPRKLSLEDVRPQWLACQQQLERVNPRRRTGNSISVVQMNILAGNLASPQHFPYVMEENLRWENRRRTLLRQLDDLDADVICLEELNDYWTFFKPQLQERGYESVYVKRPSIYVSTWSGEKKQDGCGIFYKKDKFELQECESVNFHDQHDRVALLALLKLPSVNQFVVVGCTHLWWNPKEVDQQVAELAELEDELVCMNTEIKNKYRSVLSSSLTGKTHIPMIVCGDFNNNPDSALYEYMEHRFMQRPNAAGARESFRSAYGHYKQNVKASGKANLEDDRAHPDRSIQKDEPPHTTVNYRRCWTIDYIWYTCSCMVPQQILAIPPESILRAEEGPANWLERIELADTYTKSAHLPGESLEVNHNGIPNSLFGSDHVPIMARLEFLAPSAE